MSGLQASDEDSSLTILKARIALLATAIGGPDHTSQLDPPPYKLGDDCLACLRDLKRWFKLVDDQQNRWDVAMACAEYRILIDDLLPILIDWDTKSSLASKLARKDKDSTEPVFRNREYYNNIALNCLQLMVLMTWPLVLTEQSSSHQVSLYTDLKKHQLSYKKEILLTDNGRVLKAANRLAVNVLKINKLDRTPRDNMVLRLVLHFLRNLLAIEPGELSISPKQKASNRGINPMDMLPPGVSMDDISLNTVISAFHHNKVFGLLLTLSSSPAGEFDLEFINLPIMEVLFFMTKDISHQAFHRVSSAPSESSKEDECSTTGLQLTQLLEKERRLKKIVVQNTSTRHSRFGALLSIQTPDKVRLTVSGSQNLLDDSSALKKLDNRKKWKKRVATKQNDFLDRGLPNTLLNSESKSVHLRSSTLKSFMVFLKSFIDSAFNIVLRRITSHFTTELDEMTDLQQIQYLLFYSWFLSYNREQSKVDESFDVTCVSVAVEETTFILVSSLMRKGYEEKNWIVTHAAMVAFNELLLLMNDDALKFTDNAGFILSRLFSNDRIQLLVNLPKSALRNSLQYMRSCVHLTHTALKTFEAYDSDSKLKIIGKEKHNPNQEFTETDVTALMQSEGLDRDEALEVLTSTIKEHTVKFEKVLRCYMNEPTIDSYVSFLQRFRELEDEDLKRGLTFLHRVLIQETEQSLLFRIDLIVLLRDMLSSQGLSKASRVKKHVENLSNYYLRSLRKKLEKSPAWFAGLLFPLLHDSEVGFYQKYGEAKIIKKTAFYAVLPSRFKPIENEAELPSSHVLDLRFGILVSSLIDDGKQELLEGLIKHLRNLLANRFSNHSQEDAENELQGRYDLRRDTGLSHDSLCFDKDFRALLALLGYHLPSNIKEACRIPRNISIGELEENVQRIEKYMSTPFETPNGLPSSSYLIRPKINRDTGLEEQDGWQSNEEYDYNDPGIVPDDENDMIDDNGYFDSLQIHKMSKPHDRHVAKGVAKTKRIQKKKKATKISRTNLPTFDVNDDIVRKERAQTLQFSKEIISDSDDDDVVNPIFFENEMYMRYLLDRHGGQLPDSKYAEFGKFAAERMANNGKTVTDFSELFGRDVSDITDLRKQDLSKASPDRTLFTLSSRISAQIEVHLANNDQSEQESPTQAALIDYSTDSERASRESGSKRSFTHDDDDEMEEEKEKEEDDSQTSMTPNDSDDDYEATSTTKKRKRVFVQDDDD